VYCYGYATHKAGQVTQHVRGQITIIDLHHAVRRIIAFAKLAEFMTEEGKA
jgi:hypothetical protein